MLLDELATLLFYSMWRKNQYCARRNVRGGCFVVNAART